LDNLEDHKQAQQHYQEHLALYLASLDDSEEHNG